MIKELRSFRSDPVMLALVAYSFTIAIYAAATGASTEATNLSVAIVDEDHSDLSRRIADGLTPPTFKPAVQIAATGIDAAIDSQRVIYVIEFPPKFETDVLAGRQPTVQIDVDATAAAQAFNGMTYIQNVINDYVTQFVAGREGGNRYPGQGRYPGKVQSEFEVELVHRSDADHQQSHHDHRHAHRRCAHSRARAGYG